MSAMDVHGVGLIRDLPADLRAWMEERRVLELALEAVDHVGRRNPAVFAPGDFHRFNPRMLMTLLAYCYATDTFGSDDVEWAAVNEATVRYLCGRHAPDQNTVRRFRRAHRQWIEQCLVWMLNRAMVAVVFPEAESSADVLLEAENFGDACLWARRKVDLAVLADTAAVD